MDICIQIGNTDNKLTQQEWSEFIYDVEVTIKHWSSQIYFSGFSRPDVSWQNACWIFSCTELDAIGVQEQLVDIREIYKQDSIAWSELTTEFI